MLQYICNQVNSASMDENLQIRKHAVKRCISNSGQVANESNTCDVKSIPEDATRDYKHSLLHTSSLPHTGCCFLHYEPSQCGIWTPSASASSKLETASRVPFQMMLDSLFHTDRLYSPCW